MYNRRVTQLPTGAPQFAPPQGGGAGSPLAQRGSVATSEGGQQQGGGGMGGLIGMGMMGKGLMGGAKPAGGLYAQDFSTPSSMWNAATGNGIGATSAMGNSTMLSPSSGGLAADYAMNPAAAAPATVFSEPLAGEAMTASAAPAMSAEIPAGAVAGEAAAGDGALAAGLLAPEVALPLAGLGLLGGYFGMKNSWF